MNDIEKLVQRAELLMDYSQTENPWEHRDEIFEILFNAFNEGNARACYLLARAYLEMELTEPDYDKADYYYKVGAERGEGDCLFHVSCGYKNTSAEALTLLEKSAKAGSAAGLTYYANAIFKNYPYKAIKYLKKASRMHYPHANYLLTEIYLYGYRFYVEPDFALAKKYAFKNKECEYIFSLVHIGNIYDFGIATSKNHKKAREWYLKYMEVESAGEGYGYLARHYIYGLGGLKKDYAKAIELLNKAIDEKTVVPLLYYELSRCYRLGLGVEKNVALANDYHNKWLALTRK